MGTARRRPQSRCSAPGRVYECLDRGALATTWVDVFFYNTADGIAWQSLLGGTISDIELVN